MSMPRQVIAEEEHGKQQKRGDWETEKGPLQLAFNGGAAMRRKKRKEERKEGRKGLLSKDRVCWGVRECRDAKIVARKLIRRLTQLPGERQG